MGRTHSWAYYLLTYHHSLRELEKAETLLKKLKPSGDLPAYRRRIRALRRRIARTRLKLKKTNAFINTIADPYIKKAITLRYTKNYSWLYTATQMGRPDLADSLRMMVNRYIKELASYSESD